MDIFSFINVVIFLIVGFTTTALAYTEELAWWQTTIVYQIYPRSFQDSNGDGVGDLQGIISRLDYVKLLNVDAVWLSPIYTSPMADFGYDIADYYNIDPIFGTLADFDELVKEVHKRDMKIIMDYVPNHTSDKHQWFIESKKGGENNKYTDYYRWHSGKILDNGTRVPPNNWLSIFGGSAWQWVEDRQQYYLHQFLIEQPDLDYRNPQVVREMQEVFKFWLERGVDGFRIDAILTLFEVVDVFQDEPQSLNKGFQPDEHEFLQHIYTLHQPEIHDVVKGWANVIGEYEEKSGKEIFMVMEVYDETLEESMKYYGSGANMPFNFGLIYVNNSCGGKCFKTIIDKWMTLMPEGEWPNFVLSNHDQRRITTRKGAEYVNALNILLLTLPGTPTTYYGEEIGMLDIPVLSFEETKDPNGLKLGPELYAKYSRDPCRSPMQWNSEVNSGFSNSKDTWLPVHNNYKQLNVELQSKNSKSPLRIYQQTAQLRKHPAFQSEDLIFHVVNDNILSYVRPGNGTEAFLVILNLGLKKQVNEYSWPLGDKTVTSGEVMVNTGNFDENSLYHMGSNINLSSLSLDPGQGLIVKLSLSEVFSDELRKLLQKHGDEL